MSARGHRVWSTARFESGLLFQGIPRKWRAQLPLTWCGFHSTAMDNEWLERAVGEEVHLGSSLGDGKWPAQRGGTYWRELQGC